MSSLPTIDPNIQWDTIRDTLRDTNLSVVVVSEIIKALLQLIEHDGYGSITLTVAAGQVLEFKVVKSKRLSENVFHDHEEVSSVEIK